MCIHILMWFMKFEVKVAQWKNGFIKKQHSTANLNFLFLSLFVYLFFSVFQQLEVSWASVLQWGTELSPLQKPKQKPNSQFWGGKIQICCIVRSFYKTVLPLGHLYLLSYVLKDDTNVCLFTLLAFYSVLYRIYPPKIRPLYQQFFVFLPVFFQEW